MMRWLLAAGLCCLALAGVTLAGGAAHAQTVLRPTGSPPILFSADELQTDEDLGLVIAKGHVQISQDQQTLLADTVSYNRKTDTITASGNVSLQQPTGEVLFADFMELSDRLQNGFMQNLRVLLADRSRLAGNTGRRTDGNRTELRRGVYSPCDLCKDDPTEPPLWQLRAKRVIHDETTHLIEYHDAVMELGGVPVLYTPYLSHADPTVKRQSGFLVPTVGNSSTLGAHTTIPYFWAISRDRDLTLSPIFTTDQGAVANAEYRQRWGNGELRLEGSLNNGLAPDDQTRSTVRGHVDSAGLWDLSNTWRAGFALQRASDQTYERLFHFGGTQNFLTSRGYAEQFDRNNFFGINAYTWQTLRQFTSDSNQPLVTPVVDYHWLGEPDRLGGRLSADANVLNLNRLRGTGSHRVSLGTAWTKPFNGLIGDVFTFTASTRADGYETSDIQVDANQARRNAYTGRVFPQLSLEWRYPWLRRGEDYSQLIEPVAMFVAGPKGENPLTISNEDSLAFDFSDTDLFVPNRFAGLDRVDSGDRVDYGLRASIFGNSASSTSALSMLIGQSFRLQNNGGFAVGSGLEDKRSDIVGRFVIAPNETFDAVYRYRLSKKNLTIQREEVGISAGPPKLRLSLSYIKLPPDLLSSDTGKREQIAVGAAVGLSRYWTMQLSTTKNLTGQLGTVSSGIIATYQDECFAFITALSQSGTQDRDVKPGASLVFSLVFKNLGEVSAPAFATQGIR